MEDERYTETSDYDDRNSMSANTDMDASVGDYYYDAVKIGNTTRYIKRNAMQYTSDEEHDAVKYEGKSPTEYPDREYPRQEYDNDISR